MLAQFGDHTKPVGTELVNPYILRCILPPSDSARFVSVTLHWQGSGRLEIQNQQGVIFEYQDIGTDLSVRDYLVLVWC